MVSNFCTCKIAKAFTEQFTKFMKIVSHNVTKQVYNSDTFKGGIL